MGTVQKIYMIQMCDIKISLDGIIRRKKSKKPPLGRQGCKKWVRSTDVQTFTKDYSSHNVYLLF